MFTECVTYKLSPVLSYLNSYNISQENSCYKHAPKQFSNLGIQLLLRYK